MCAMGLLLWFAAEITISYYYFILLIKEVPPPVSFADVLWLVGHVFFPLHLFITSKIIQPGYYFCIKTATFDSRSAANAYEWTGVDAVLVSSYLLSSYGPASSLSIKNLNSGNGCGPSTF